MVNLCYRGWKFYRQLDTRYHQFTENQELVLQLQLLTSHFRNLMIYFRRFLLKKIKDDFYPLIYRFSWDEFYEFYFSFAESIISWKINLPALTKDSWWAVDFSHPEKQKISIKDKLFVFTNFSCMQKKLCLKSLIGKVILATNF